MEGRHAMKTNVIYNKDCRHMDEVEDGSVHLVCTSPPYNVGMEYNNERPDRMALADYLAFTREWIAEAVRKLAPGGRIAINIANTGRKPYIPLNHHVVGICLDLGLLMFQEYIWNKGRAVAAGKTSWGTWRDARSPQARDCHEYIEVFCKPGHEINAKGDEDPYALPCEGYEKSKYLTGHDFALGSFSVWDIGPETSKKIKSVHPAPFPVELARRMIEFLTRPGQIVLDPFAGSASTWVACQTLPEPRRFIGYEINPDYVKFATRRVAKVTGPKLEIEKPKGLEAFARG